MSVVLIAFLIIGIIGFIGFIVGLIFHDTVLLLLSDILMIFSFCSLCWLCWNVPTNIPTTEDVEEGKAHIDTVYNIVNRDTTQITYKIEWNKDYDNL